MKTGVSWTENADEIERLRAENERLKSALRAGEKLSDWMRNYTGPHDGTAGILSEWHHAALKAAP